ncbi:MAG: ABC transporter ATP-binding protein [Polaromonas sp.]|uniref:ABC transporter ATP-binding protein n=1 Tax=Polaromonas sp. TaxID=1869339 RepID=UPI002488EB72|nr:ABC transporter ATP-binding protein [Polaromonas sp.]MDI1269149.1 ABC transporter ATP-binding protein [Polaromonas sp.]
MSALLRVAAEESLRPFFQPTGPDGAIRTAPTGKPLVSIRDLRVAFDDGASHVPVLHGIDLDIHRGEALGIVGESGCGKSVTWLAVLGLLGPRAQVSGSIHLDQQPIHGLANDDLAAIRGKRIAMIFQDPASALNPIHRVGRQITEALKLHRGLRGQAAHTEALRLLERVHIPNARQRFDAYPHEMSGGMNQRVMIAMALAGEPDMLVADEPTTALDVTIQAQILDLLREIREDSGMAMALISHDLGVIAEVCDRVMVMYAGRMVEQAPARRLFDAPHHPYTRGLMSALPDLAAPQRRLIAIAGSVPEAGRLPKGCSFGPRCGQVHARCKEALPPTREVHARHHVACQLPVAA